MPTVAAIANVMGRRHDSKPVTKADVKMSKKHLKNRAKVEKMRGKEKLKASIKYNEAHAKEHLKAMKARRKELVKIKING